MFLPIGNCLQSERRCALFHFVVVLCFGIENLRLELPHVLAARANYIQGRSARGVKGDLVIL